MAERPVFLPNFSSELLVKTQFINFQWHPGMAPSQKRKSIKSLHEAARKEGICEHPLEISSKSPEEIGVQLSAFNLSTRTKKQDRSFTVETAYQSSKIFKNGGPYQDLLYGTSLAAKKDPRLKESGDLIGFRFFGIDWCLEPQTAFYDWLYINTLRKNTWATEALGKYDAFTDIEFNPQKSINCQAYSVALYKALEQKKLIGPALEKKETFLDVIKETPINNSRENTLTQPNLI